MTNNSAQDLTRFDLLVKQRELNQTVADQLKNVLSTCEIVLLCDDSDSMNNPIAEEGTDPFAPKKSTRWLELKKLAAVIIEFVTAINSNGLDIYFLNREKICNVNTLAGLQSVFSAAPNGGTPLITSLNKVYLDKINNVNQNRKLLIVVIGDGEASDGSRQDLYNKLIEITDNGNIHISFAECTDNAEDMEYLDQWDGCIKNFDNTDDYREELMRVKTIQGAQFKFDFTDYIIKILLATFVRWYFNLDQVKVVSNQNNNYQLQQNQSYNYQYKPQDQYVYVQQYNPSPFVTPAIQQYNTIQSPQITDPFVQPVQQYVEPQIQQQTQQIQQQQNQPQDQQLNQQNKCCACNIL